MFHHLSTGEVARSIRVDRQARSAAVRVGSRRRHRHHGRLAEVVPFPPTRPSSWADRVAS